MSSVSVTTGGASFVILAGGDHCSGISIAAGGQCYVYLEFSPTAAGYGTGTLTFTDSKANKYAVPIAGYAAALSVSAYADPTTLNFPGQVLTTTSPTQTFSLFNSGNTPLKVGILTGTNTIVGTSTTGVFSTNATQGGSDSCSGATVTVGSRCTVYVAFTPATAAAATGAITVPITYSNSTTASFTVNLSGTGLSVVDSSQLSPTALAFPDQAVKAVYGAGADAPQTINLDNTGNLPITLGSLTSTDVVVGTTTTGDFSTSGTVGGYDGCSGQQVAPRSSCQVTVAFTPAATGSKSGSVVFPVTYADKTTAKLTASVTGKGIAASSTVVVTPTSGQFDAQVVGTTSTNNLTITVTNTGNQPVKITTSTLTSSFSFAGDYCSGTTVGINSSCTITVAFSPTTSGSITGTLTIPDNATGNPHKVALSGTGLPTTSQIALSQTALKFGQQLVGTKSGALNVFVTNQSTSTVTISTVTLGGTNATDYVESNTCAGTALTGLQYCTISVAFNPATASTGVRTASIVETDSASGSPRTITLTGTGVAAAPAIAFYPNSLNFGTVDLGTESAPMTFSVTNTGNANLVIGTVVSSNATEFPITSNTCAGKTIAAGNNCLVNIAFKPNSGSTQTSTITLTDNGTGSPQTLTVTGLSLGIPKGALSPTSLAFSSEGVGVASPTKAITLSNAGTDVLKIASVAVTGTDASSFTQTNTCGTSIAAGANCAITLTFTPKAVGSLTASVVVTDNAGNVTGTTQTATLSGTGTGVARISFSPTSLTYASTDVAVASATQSITLSNPGTAPLAISTIGISGTDPADYSQTNTCPASVAVSGTCTITVAFKPTVAGTRTATVSVTDNAAASPQTVALSGTAVGVAEATVSGPITFAAQTVGTTSSAKTATITDSGSASLVVASFAISGTNASDFKATSTACPGTIAIGANCGISITFTPAASGARTASLTITDNAGNVTGTKQTIALSGTGAGVPQAIITPSTGFAFASEAVGGAAGPLKVTLSNPGTGPLTISSIAITGANTADYYEFDTCVPTVNVNATCEIALYFAPKAVGALNASVVVTDNAGNVTNATQSIPVTGTGTGTAQISFSKTALTFAAQKVGTLGPGQSITVTNTGNATLTISTIALSGADPGDYMQFNGCSSVAAGDTCELVVFFEPTATGTRTASVVFTDNAKGVTNATQSVTLTGTGD